MSHLDGMSRTVRAGWLAIAVLLAGAGADGAEGEPAALRFIRVHVPAGRLGDVDLGAERRVPLPVAEFDRLVAVALAAPARDGGAGVPTALADGGRITCRFDATGRPVGTLALSYSAESSGPPADVALGRFTVRRAARESADGTGPALIHALADGATALRIAGPGIYTCDWEGDAVRPTGPVPGVDLPVAPALSTVVEIEIPDGRRPVGGGVPWEPLPLEPRVDVAPGTPSSRVWRAVVGPVAALAVRLVSAGSEPVGLRCWTTYDVSPGAVAVRTVVEPVPVWLDGVVRLRVDDGVTVVAATVATGAEQGRALTWVTRADGVDVSLPAGLAGTRLPLAIVGIAPARADTIDLPRLSVGSDAWRGGGMSVRVDPTLALAGLEPDEAIPVAAAAAATWPDVGAAEAETDAAIVHLSAQGPDARVGITVEPRGPLLDIARATTVDVASARVIGLATCDIRVPRGEAFVLTGRVGPGWIIDAVEQALPGGRTGEVVTTRQNAPPDEAIEWRVNADAAGNRLRIGLAAAATPARAVVLRITGHRAGLDVGGVLAVGDLEMVALDGEEEGQAALVLRAPTDAMLDIDPVPAALPPPVSRVTALLGREPVRSWLPAGSALPVAEVRLVRRRPPVTVHCRVGMTVRDDRVAETYVFECQPGEAAIDSLVVHFSEPIEEFAEWALLRPGAGTVVARPVELPGQRGGESSWLIDLVPASRDTVTIRAARSVPLAGVTPVPLARVEGAVAFSGEVVVRTAGRRRPTVVNRRLTELPPAPSRPGEGDAIVAEFGFDDDAADAAASEGAALELVPDGGGGERDAGAWVWSQTVDCWCHRSGATEVESRFAIENHGRPSLTLQVPAGNRLQAILVDGRRIVTDRDGAIGELSVDLPVDQRRVTLTVRSIATVEAAGEWLVSSAGATVDLPVLERAWRVWLPPGVELRSGPRRHREVGAPGIDWCRRLFGFDPWAARGELPTPAADGMSGGLVAGCQERVFVPLPGPPADDRVGLIASEDLERIAFLAGTVLTGCLLAAAAWRPGLLTLGPVVAALVALWIPAPWHVVARAVWWGMAMAALARVAARRRQRRAAASAVAAVALVTASACGADDAAGMRVIVTPVGGVPTALVPETLFDRLGAAGSGGRPRVLGVEVTVPGPRSAAWGVRVEVDADSGSSLVLPAAPGTVPAEGVVLVDGRRVPLLGSDTGPARVPIAEAGRHRLEWSVVPERIDRGGITVETAGFPPAPRASATVGPDPVSRGALVEMARPGGPFTAAPRDAAWADGVQRAYDIAGADRLALVVAPPAVVVDPVPRAARSRNDIVWGPTACRLESRFDIEMDDDLLPAVVLDADPRLVPGAVDDPAIVVEPVASGRFRVVRTRPEPGPFRFELGWTLPLDEPTGVHPLPEVWLEAPRADERTVRLTPAAGLRAALLSSGTVPGARPVAAGAELSWRVDRGAGDASPPALDGLPAATGMIGAGRVLVTRAPAALRGTQQLRLALASGRIDMTLEARIEADGALVAIPLRTRGDVQLGAVTLSDETGAERTRQALDVRVVPGRGADGRGSWTVVLQRPQAGRIRLDVEAFVSAATLAEGELPTVQAVLEGSGPTVVTWSAVDGMAAEVAGAEVAPAGVFELPADGPPPGYRLVAVSRRGDEPAPPAPPTPPAPSAPSGPRLELVDTVLAVDARGRGWGVARLDVVALEPILRLSLPGGCRPYKVFVDGRSVTDPVPVGSARAPRWEVRLFDVRWPRSLEVVFAGELGAGIDSGDLTALDAPGIDGLPAAATLWTIMVPRATALRVAPPAALVPATTLADERAAALDRLAGDFTRAIDAVSPGEATRLGDILAARRAPPSLQGVDATAIGATGSDVFAVGATVIGPGDGAPLEFRLVRGADPTAPARALASAVAIVAGGILRVVWRRWFPGQAA